MRLHLCFTLIGLLGLMIIIVGCSIGMPSSQVGTPTSVRVVNTPSITAMPLSTMTMPATPTIIPTYSSEESQESILNLVKNNGGCTLPCLLGFTPGSSPLQSVKDFSSRYGNFEIEKQFYVSSHEFADKGGVKVGIYENATENNSWIRLEFPIEYYASQTGELEQIVFEPISIQEKEEGNDLKIWYVYGNSKYNEINDYYSLSNILTTYGNPSTILVAPFPTSPEDPKAWVPFSLILVYKDSGFLLEYITTREKAGNYYEGCPSASRVIVTSWTLNDKLSLEKVVSRLSGDGVNENNLNIFYKPINEVTSMSLDNFVRTYQKVDNQNCLETPINLWPSP